MRYLPLNSKTEELRLISVLPRFEPGQTQSSALPHHENDDLVHCTLQHYPLTREYWTGRDSSFPLDWTTDACSDVTKKSANGDLDAPQRERLDAACKWRFVWGDYVALSYTWGNPADRKELVVNGEVVKVQANLEAALRAIRHKRPTRRGYCVWVDALCINQEDFGERSREVRRMRMIYRIAADVVIWLGPEAEESDKAMDLIRVLSDTCINHTDKALGEELRRNPEHLQSGAWLALSELLERQYWNRMWIIQELCLGGGSAPILCGEKCVTWNELYAAVFTFGEHNVDVMFACIDRERKAVGKAPFGLNRNKIIHVNKEHQKQSGGGDVQYMCLLDLARKSDASNPRDKVYGILGLMDPAVASLVTLDYSLSVERVYTDFVMQYIVGTQSLEILEQCRFNETPLPSWVPDWRNKNHYRLFSGSYSAYHAGGGSIPSYRFWKGGSILDVNGIVIDAIDGLGHAYFESGTSSHAEHNMFQPEFSTNVYGSEGSIQDALWRTLTGDRTLAGLPARHCYADILQLPLKERDQDSYPSRGARAFTRFILQNRCLSVFGNGLDSYFSNLSDQFPQTTVDAVERIWRFTRMNRLMMTRAGRIGMVPHEARKGDMVCVLMGLNAPVLLRPGSSRRDPVKLVGSCYVHGVMAGEAIQWVKEGLHLINTISIC